MTYLQAAIQCAHACKRHVIGYSRRGDTRQANVWKEQRAVWMNLARQAKAEGK